MAYSYSYHAGQKIILVLQTGTTNYYKETLDWMMNVRADPQYDRKYGVLCDFREGTVHLTSTDAFTCGMLLGRLFAGHRIAYVIPDALKAMVEKQILAVQSAAQVRDFSAIRDAEAWLAAGV